MTVTGGDDPDKMPLEFVLEKAFSAFMQDVHTSFPARITEFDESTNRATLRALVQYTHVLEDETTQTDTIADLHDVPVLFPINNKGGMLYPIGVGDDVYVHIASCSLAQIKVKGGQTDPKDARRNHISDAVAYPAWFSFNKVPFPSSGNVDINAAAGVLIRSGGGNANDFAVKGSTYRTAEDRYLGLLETLIGAIVAQPAMATYFLTGAPATALAAWNAGVRAFHLAASTYLSQVNKLA